MAWKGESRRHSLARRGIKTIPENIRSSGRKKKIPEVYFNIDRSDYMKRVSKWDQNQYYTRSGNLAHDLSVAWDSPLKEIYGSNRLTYEQLLEIIDKYPDAMLSAKFYSSGRGGVNRRKIKIGNIIFPNDPLLLQIEVGTEVELEHTVDKREARKIALDHLQENHEYYTILLNAFPDEHPELRKRLESVA